MFVACYEGQEVSNMVEHFAEIDHFGLASIDELPDCGECFLTVGGFHFEIESPLIVEIVGQVEQRMHVGAQNL